MDVFQHMLSFLAERVSRKPSTMNNFNVWTRPSCPWSRSFAGDPVGQPIASMWTIQPPSNPSVSRPSIQQMPGTWNRARQFDTDTPLLYTPCAFCSIQAEIQMNDPTAPIAESSLCCDKRMGYFGMSSFYDPLTLALSPTGGEGTVRKPGRPGGGIFALVRQAAGY